ncbi:virion protein [Shewanella sp. Scap07]|uniref:virion protein n=1 Tax=Shewanella sp. Scap07 TaxID=2589987 RepID=UPI0021192B3A|nr:virion protein [Shewanella sp. Scap07]
MAPTKGIRNNNPLNVEYSERNPWQGQSGTDGRFAIFETAFYGIRAAARTMKTYRDKHGLKTIEAIVNRWAPPSDNNPTQNYINFVANKAGVTATKPLSMADYPRVVAAMIHFENGYNPYEHSEISSATAAGFK